MNVTLQLLNIIIIYIYIYKYINEHQPIKSFMSPFKNSLFN